MEYNLFVETRAGEMEKEEKGNLMQHDIFNFFLLYYLFGFLIYF